MKVALDDFFSELSLRVTARFVGHFGLTNHQSIRTNAEFPSIEQLLNSDDRSELNDLFSQYYGELLEDSWETWNQALGVDVDFSLYDPAVITVLNDIPNRTNDILETTWQAINKIFIEEAESEGWSITSIARRLEGLVEETYQNRNRTIARTEMGTAQNRGTTERYRATGISKVLVLDNGFENSHEKCKALSNTIQTLEWAQDNPLEHPNCVRAFAPHFED